MGIYDAEEKEGRTMQKGGRQTSRKLYNE